MRTRCPTRSQFAAERISAAFSSSPKPGRPMPNVALRSRAIRASFSSTGSGFQSMTGPGAALCMCVTGFPPNRSG
jgi:hypothetical protein